MTEQAARPAARTMNANGLTFRRERRMIFFMARGSLEERDGGGKKTFFPLGES
jgi:hypothetical protein